MTGILVRRDEDTETWREEDHVKDVGRDWRSAAARQGSRNHQELEEVREGSLLLVNCVSIVGLSLCSHSNHKT